MIFLFISNLNFNYMCRLEIQFDRRITTPPYCTSQYRLRLIFVMHCTHDYSTRGADISQYMHFNVIHALLLRFN